MTDEKGENPFQKIWRGMNCTNNSPQDFKNLNQTELQANTALNIGVHRKDK